MVAVIKDGYSIRNIVTYNENKVKKGVAECISAVNYPKDLEWLSFGNKLNRLTHQASLRPTVKRNHLHISLNFDPSEQLEKEKMARIADTYMKKMGMDDLPYLVYQHHDAGHPHIHIVTMKIRSDGTAVNLDYAGKNQSGVARREIEIEYGLVKADDHADEEEQRMRPINVQKAIYGRTETKRAITNIVGEVFDRYQFSSFGEYNTILSRFNVVADPGTKASRTFQKRGLNYNMLDENGNKVGLPIKASLFYNKPTLAEIEKKCLKHASRRYLNRKKLKDVLDRYFLTARRPCSEDLKAVLEKQNIEMVLHQNKDGSATGISFIDFKHRCIFKGSDIDRSYSLKGIEKKFNNPAITAENRHKFNASPTVREERLKTLPPQVKPDKPIVNKTVLSNRLRNNLYKVPYANPINAFAMSFHITNRWLQVTLGPEHGAYEPVPYAFLNGRYKKTRKKQGN